MVRNWFLATISVLTVLVAVYMVLHMRIPGAEVIKLSKQEITDMNMILFGNNKPSRPAGDEPGEADGDAAAAAGGVARGSSAPTDSVRRESMYNYIYSVRPPYNPKDSTAFRRQFESYSPEQFAAVMPNYPIRVKSYFWLTEGRREGDQTIEGSIYLEIVFWTLFGLIANLLYRVSESVRTDGFRPEEIGVHIAKFFYAPLCSLVVFFSFNMLVSQGDISVVQFSHATIVLAFILGFFSGRTVELLERIKDLLLPLNRRQEEAAAAAAAAAAVPQDFATLKMSQQTELAQAASEKNLSEWQKTYVGLKGVIPWKKTSTTNGQTPETVLLFQVELPEGAPDHTGQIPAFITYKGYQIPTEVELTRMPKPETQPDAGNGPGGA
jgi:hypothetical protein